MAQCACLIKMGNVWVGLVFYKSDILKRKRYRDGVRGVLQFAAQVDERLRSWVLISLYADDKRLNKDQ